MGEDRFEQLGKELLRKGWTLTEAESGVEQMMGHLAGGRPWAVASLLIQKTPPALSAGCPFFSWPYFSETLLREYEGGILEELEQVHGFTREQALLALADIRERIERSEDGRVVCGELLVSLKEQRDQGAFSRPSLYAGNSQWWREPVRFEPAPVGVMPPERQEIAKPERLADILAGPVLSGYLQERQVRHDVADNRLVVRAGYVENNRLHVSLSGQGTGESNEFLRFGPEERGRYMRGGWQTEAMFPPSGGEEPRIALKRIGALSQDVMSLAMAEEVFTLMGLAIMDARRMKRDR